MATGGFMSWCGNPCLIHWQDHFHAIAPASLRQDKPGQVLSRERTVMQRSGEGQVGQDFAFRLARAQGRLRGEQVAQVTLGDEILDSSLGDKT